MKLVADWREVLRHAWSIRLMFVAALLSGLDAAQPLVAGLLPIPPMVFAGLAALIAAGAFIARLQFTSPRFFNHLRARFGPTKRGRGR